MGEEATTLALLQVVREEPARCGMILILAQS